MIVYRSAITGRFVSKEYAEKHPDTTIRQEIDTVSESCEEDGLTDEQQRVVEDYRVWDE